MNQKNILIIVAGLLLLNIISTIISSSGKSEYSPYTKEDVERIRMSYEFEARLKTISQAYLVDEKIIEDYEEKIIEDSITISNSTRRERDSLRAILNPR